MENKVIRSEMKFLFWLKKTKYHKQTVYLLLVAKMSWSIEMKEACLCNWANLLCKNTFVSDISDSEFNNAYKRAQQEVNVLIELSPYLAQLDSRLSLMLDNLCAKIEAHQREINWYGYYGDGFTQTATHAIHPKHFCIAFMRRRIVAIAKCKPY